jgi:hypothetical protein
MFGKRMERREAISDCEKYQGTKIRSECEWNGSVEWLSGVGKWLRK